MGYLQDPLDDFMRRHLLERDEKWRAITPEVPALSFPAGWSIKVIPPFGGAVARFLVVRGDATVSVYLDWYGRLGAMDRPYWECHPDASGEDCARFYMDEGDQLVAEIGKSLARQNRKARAK